jgi:hypothetical protein
MIIPRMRRNIFFLASALALLVHPRPASCFGGDDAGYEPVIEGDDLRLHRTIIHTFMLCAWDILIVSHGQCNNAATVGRKRDGGKYPKTWDSNYGSYPGRFYSQYQNTTLPYSSRACMSFHFGINGKSRSRLLVHLAPTSQSGQSSHFLLKWED